MSSLLGYRGNPRPSRHRATNTLAVFGNAWRGSSAKPGCSLLSAHPNIEQSTGWNSGLVLTARGAAHLTHPARTNRARQFRTGRVECQRQMALRPRGNSTRLLLSDAQGLPIYGPVFESYLATTKEYSSTRRAPKKAGPLDLVLLDAGLYNSASKRQPPGGSIGAIVRPRIERNRRSWGNLTNSIDDHFE